MIQKAVKRRKLGSFSEISENLEYWLSRTPEERVAAVQVLRRQHGGCAAGIKRCVRIIKQEQHGIE